MDSVKHEPITIQMNKGNTRMTNTEKYNPLIFDIETMPLDDESLLRLMPSFDPTKIKGYELIGVPFDDSLVKYGQMKDPEKRAAKLQDRKDKHNAAITTAQTAIRIAEQDQFRKFKDKCCLSARKSRVAAIGYNGKKIHIDCREDEWAMILSFWQLIVARLDNGGIVVGHNIHGFDLPYLMRRTWLLGSPISLNYARR